MMSLLNERVLDKIWEDFDSMKYSLDTDTNEENKCLCNNNSSIIEIDDSILCENCGFVFSFSMISHEAEWRSFNTDNGFNNSGNRCGQATDSLTPISSLSTVISGNSRLANLNMWLSIPHSEKVLMDLKKIITEIVILNQLPNSIIKNTLIIFKKLINTKNSNGQLYIYRGKNRDGLLSVCMYYASKSNNCNISSSAISKMFNIDKKTFSKCCKLYTEILSDDKIDHTSFTPSDFVERFSNKLGLSFNIQKLCKLIITASMKLQIYNNSAPQSIVAGIIYFINIEMKLNIDKYIIAKNCDISQITIIKIYKIIEKNKTSIFNIVKDLKKSN